MTPFNHRVVPSDKKLKKGTNMTPESPQVTIFLSLDGKAGEAITYYQEVLGARTVFSITNREFKERYNPDLEIAPGREEYISHSVNQVGAVQLQIADNPVDDGIPVQEGNRVSLDIMVTDPQQARTVYDKAISHPETTVLKEPQANEFADFHAVIQDPFGVLMQITCEK